MKLVKINNANVDKTLEAWQPFYDDKLTRDDAIEIQNNLSDFSQLLNKWQRNKAS